MMQIAKLVLLDSTTAVITTHHDIALRFRFKLRYLVICAVVTAAVITAAYFFNNITPFKNAANKFILFWVKYYCFSVSIYKYKFIFILSDLVNYFINTTSKIRNLPL